ncbi:ParB N-terminal domain-containing protein [Capillimicrobium parvum]|uniref:Chromosome partitioning protein ParB n=1 Tax=Capillimicrobium parvum TaxID=2884022 RepID=A0A9E7C0C5_9ACTN|nr:hypothetical protein [Capillimicrobium parvum]UGS36270.1 hypothetical protein DSM104329_02671 [Capillimicrobium parvum]
MPPLRTGLSNVDAADDFRRARRQAAYGRLSRVLTREHGDVNVILPFDEVVAALGRTGERELGLQVVELDTIAGTVDRRTGFDRSFRPTSSRVRTRWERVAAAMRRGEPLPPVSLYRVGEVHFVRDGHHRVSAARALGWSDIDAYVTEVLTRVGAGRELRISDLPLKSHERLFRERVPLSPDRAGRIRLTDAHEYGSLAEGVEAWGFRQMQERGELRGRADVAEAWFDHEFAPVIELLREADMLGPGTEADAYHRIASERYELTRSHDWSDEIVARVKAAEHKR